MRWLLIDRLEKCDPGKSAEAIKCFSRSDLLFLDHLRGDPVVPGVLLLEMIANTASLCYRMRDASHSPMLAVVRNAKFYRAVVPGDRCVVSLQIESQAEGYIHSTGTVSVDGKKCAEATIVSALTSPKENDYRDPVLEDWKRKNRGETLSL